MKIDFETFKKEFIDSTYGWDGYMPVYGYMSLEGPDGEIEEQYLHFHTHMVCNWRLDDGPSRFVRIYDVSITRDQVQEIQNYLLKAAETFKEEMTKAANETILSGQELK